jgi:hypothetical protein
VQSVGPPRSLLLQGSLSSCDFLPFLASELGRFLPTIGRLASCAAAIHPRISSSPSRHMMDVNVNVNVSEVRPE